MTRNEAIARLKIYRNYLCKMSSMFDVNEVSKPFNMAIEALEQQKSLLKQIEELKKENDFLKKMQQNSTKDMSNEQLGKIVYQTLKNKF